MWKSRHWRLSSLTLRARISRSKSWNSRSRLFSLLSHLSVHWMCKCYILRILGIISDCSTLSQAVWLVSCWDYGDSDSSNHIAPAIPQSGLDKTGPPTVCIWESYHFRRTNRFLTECLTRSSEADGSSIIVRTCDSSSGIFSSEWWRVEQRTPTAYRLRSLLSDGCLDVPDGNDADGTKMQVWTCYNGNANQLWELHDDNTFRWASNPNLYVLLSHHFAQLHLSSWTRDQVLTLPARCLDLQDGIVGNQVRSMKISTNFTTDDNHLGTTLDVLTRKQ
jgi:hypothetical protein